MPVVSVIIPTYNRSHLIRDAVQTILDQSYQDFEIIIVDDGSTDSTYEVVKNINDKRIHYVRHDTNKGAAAARNTGIRASSGKFIAFQDSDDTWSKDKLEKQIKAFETASEQVGVVYTGCWEVKNGRKTYMPSPYIKQKEGDLHNALLKKYIVTTPAAVVKKECFEKAGLFDERFRRFEEWELWIRISKYYLFKCIDEPLLIQSPQPDSITASLENMVSSWELLIETHAGEFKKNRNILAYQYLRMGYYFYSYQDVRQARKCYLKAISINPLNPETVFNYLISFFGFRIYDKIRKMYMSVRNSGI